MGLTHAASTERTAAARRLSRIRRLLLSLVTLGLLSLSIHCVGFSEASFLSISENPDSVFTAGTLSHSNSRAGEIIINAADLLPGDSRSETVTITGGGDFTGDYTVSRASLDDASGLASALTVRIEDVAAGTTLFDNTVAALDAASVGTIAPGASRTYRFTLAYPVAAANSQLQGASMTMTIRFTGSTQ